MGNFRLSHVDVRPALDTSAPTLLCRIEARRIWIAAATCLGFTLVLGLFSEGCYHDDDLTHYLMARWAWWYPSYLLHIWGRPGLTAPLAAVSWIGDRFTAWHAARMMSSFVTAAGALLAARLAMRLGVRRGWLVVLACYLQPLNALLSFTTLTENWTALYLIGAVTLLHRRRFVLASIVFSLALVTRHEAVIFIPLWWAAVWFGSKQVRVTSVGAALSLWAPMAHNIFFWIVFEELPVRMYFQPLGSTEYLPTGPLTYVPQALYALPPLILAPAILCGRSFFRRDRWLLVAIPFLFFLLHAVFKAMGAFASGGYGRFMVAVAPFVGILAAAGFEQLSDARVIRRCWLILAFLFALGWVSLELEFWAGRLPSDKLFSVWLVRFFGVGLAGMSATCSREVTEGNRTWWDLQRSVLKLVTVLLIAQFALIVRPLRLRDDQSKCRAVVEWLRREQLDQRPIFATHPWIVFELGQVEHPRAHKGPRLLASMPAGTLVVYDSRYMTSDFHSIHVDVLRQYPYRLLRTFYGSSVGQQLRLEVFEKSAATLVPEQPDASYPIDLSAMQEAITGVYYLRE